MFSQDFLCTLLCVREYFEYFESVEMFCMRVMVFWNGEGFVNRMECGSVCVGYF